MLSPESAPAALVQDDELPVPRRWLGLDLATWAFVAYLVVAFFAILFHYGEVVWFFGDELGLLADRSLSDPVGLLPPQNSHWSTLPILVYQLLYALFGFTTYLPYQAAVVVLHLTLAVLIRLIMRRAGVGPWMASFVAASFVLFGSGSQNIVNGVQVSQVGSMVFGFGHAILADHDGRFGRRDLIGLGLGLLGLASSGVGPALVAAVGLAVLLRRGWRMAALHTAPLAVVYGLWYLTYRDRIVSDTGIRPRPTELVRWVASTTTGVFESLTFHWVAASLLGAAVGLGLVLALRARTWTGLRTQAAVPLAFAVGALALSATIGYERWILGIGFARSSRYLALGAALLLPVIGLALDAIAQRWRATAPVLVLLLLLGVPSNLRAFDEGGWPDGFYYNQRATMTLAAHHPCLDLVPPDLVPFPSPYTGRWIDVAFLIEARDSGRMPRPAEGLSPWTVHAVDEALGFGGQVEQTPDGVLCGGTLVPGAALDP